MNLVKSAVFFSIPSVLCQVPLITSLTWETPFQDLRIAKIVGENFFSCKERIYTAIDQLHSCPESKQLWDEMANKLTSIGYGKTEEVGKAGVSSKTGQIRISEDSNTDEIKHNLVFELNNLKQAEKFHTVEQEACEMEVDNFATAIEKIEYESAKRTYEIYESCIKGGFWPENSLYGFKEQFSGMAPWNSVESMLQLQEISGHTDSYRNAWYQTCDPQGFVNWQEKKNLKKKEIEKEIEKRKRIIDEMEKLLDAQEIQMKKWKELLAKQPNNKAGKELMKELEAKQQEMIKSLDNIKKSSTDADDYDAASLYFYK